MAEVSGSSSAVPLMPACTTAALTSGSPYTPVPGPGQRQGQQATGPCNWDQGIGGEMGLPVGVGDS